MENKRRINIEANPHNLLELSAPASYVCQVMGYITGHPFLWLKCLGESEPLELNIIFSMPRYFSGPLRWEGALFRTGNQDELTNLARSTGIADYYGLEVILNAFHLVKVESIKGCIISIIAESMEVSDTIPARFRNIY